MPAAYAYLQYGKKQEVKKKKMMMMMSRQQEKEKKTACRLNSPVRVAL